MTRLRAPLHDIDSRAELEADAAFDRLLDEAREERTTGPMVTVLSLPSGHMFFMRCSSCGSSDRRHRAKAAAWREADAHAQLDHGLPALPPEAA